MQGLNAHSTYAYVGQYTLHTWSRWSLGYQLKSSEHGLVGHLCSGRWVFPKQNMISIASRQCATIAEDNFVYIVLNLAFVCSCFALRLPMPLPHFPRDTTKNTLRSICETICNWYTYPIRCNQLKPKVHFYCCICCMEPMCRRSAAVWPSGSGHSNICICCCCFSLVIPR